MTGDDLWIYWDYKSSGHAFSIIYLKKITKQVSKNNWPYPRQWNLNIQNKQQWYPAQALVLSLSIRFSSLGLEDVRTVFEGKESTITYFIIAIKKFTRFSPGLHQYFIFLSNNSEQEEITIIRIIHLGFLWKGDWEGGQYNMPRSVPPFKIMFLLCMHSMSSMRMQQWSEHSNTECYPIGDTCFAVPLHKPSCNEPSKNHCCGVQMPSELTRTIAPSRTS